MADEPEVNNDFRIDSSKLKFYFHEEPELEPGMIGTMEMRIVLDSPEQSHVETVRHHHPASGFAKRMRGDRHEVLDPPMPCPMNGCSGDLVWKRKPVELGWQYICNNEHPWYQHWTDIQRYKTQPKPQWTDFTAKLDDSLDHPIGGRAASMIVIDDDPFDFTP